MIGKKRRCTWLVGLEVKYDWSVCWQPFIDSCTLLLLVGLHASTAPSDWSVEGVYSKEVLMHRSLTKELRKSINNVLGSSLTTMEEA